MNFNNQQLAIIEDAREIYDGLLRTGVANLADVRISNLRTVYDETFGKDGKYPEWSNGCGQCVTNCMTRIYDAVASPAPAAAPAPKKPTAKKPAKK